MHINKTREPFGFPEHKELQMWFFDTNGDGYFDVYKWDTNGDGWTDATGYDYNEDGFFDLIVYI